MSEDAVGYYRAHLAKLPTPSSVANPEKTDSILGPGPACIIGVTGRARAGKDTIAQALVAEGFTRLASADTLRETFLGMMGPTWELAKELGSAGRDMRWPLQIYGTECRNAIDRPALWLDVLKAKIVYLSVYHPVPRRLFVVPDVRFEHEANGLRWFARNCFKDCKVEIWRVERPSLPAPTDSHSSETSLESIRVDHTFINNRTLADLRFQVTSHGIPNWRQ